MCAPCALAARWVDDMEAAVRRCGGDCKYPSSAASPTPGTRPSVAFMSGAARPEMTGKTIVVLQASSAIRYVSHPMWADEKLEGTEGLPVPPDLETEFPIVRWKSEDWVPPPKP